MAGERSPDRRRGRRRGARVADGHVEERMRRTMAVAGAVAVAGLVMVGCGSDDPKALDQDQLESSLLTESDLGTGWTADTSDDSGSSSTPSCLEDVRANEGQTAKASADFENGRTTFLSEDLSSAGKDAAANFDEAKQAIDSCGDISFTSNGRRLTGTIEPIEGFEEVGDQRAAYAMSVSAEGVTLDFSVAIVQEGGVDVFVLYGGLDGADQGTFEQYVSTAIDKVHDAA
jgi:hypothetical protein